MRVVYFTLFVFVYSIFAVRDFDNHDLYKEETEANEGNCSPRALPAQTPVGVFDSRAPAKAPLGPWQTPLQGSFFPEVHCPEDRSNGAEDFLALPTLLEDQQPDLRFLPVLRPFLEEDPRSLLCGPQATDRSIAVLRELQHLGRLVCKSLERIQQQGTYSTPTAPQQSSWTTKGQKQRQRQGQERTWQRCWRQKWQRNWRQAWQRSQVFPSDPAAGTCSELGCQFPCSSQRAHDSQEAVACGTTASGAHRSTTSRRQCPVLKGASPPRGPCSKDGARNCERGTGRVARSCIQSVSGKEATEHCKISTPSSLPHLECAHLRQPDQMEGLCQRIPGAGQGHLGQDRRGFGRAGNCSTATGRCQRQSGCAHRGLRHRDHGKTRGSFCHHGRYERDGEKLRSRATTGRSLCCRPASRQEAQGRWGRRRSCWQIGLWSLNAFWRGQAIDSSVITYGPPQPISTSHWVLQWSHSVCFQTGFQSVWQACEKGHELAWELGQPASPLGHQSVGSTMSYIKHPSPRSRKTVDFDLNIMVRIADCDNTTNCIFSHEFLREWKNKPWRLEFYDYEHPELRQTFRLLDDHRPLPPARGDGAHGTIPVGGVRIDQPDLRGVPEWIEHGWPLFEWRAQVHRRGEGPTAYVRTWYLHHDHTRRWQRWREFQLDEWPQHWQRRLHALWRDQLTPAAEWHVGWITPEIPVIPGLESHLGDLVVWQSGAENRAAILCHTLCSSPLLDRVQLQALSVPLQQGRHDLLRLNHVMLQCWSSPCIIRRGTHTLLDGRLDHQDMSGISIRVEPALSATAINLVQLRAQRYRSLMPLPAQENIAPVDNVLTSSSTSKDTSAPLDGPLSDLAVLNTGESDDPPLQVTWRGMSERRQTTAHNAGIHPQNVDDDDDAMEFIHIDESEDDSQPYLPPDDSPTGSRIPEEILQSAMIYEVGQRERHAHLRWHTQPALLRSVAEFLNIPLHSILELYDLQARPEGLPDPAYPLIVHKFDDLPTGSTDQLVVLDVVIYDQSAPPVTDRRTIRLVHILSRASLLSTARVDQYCRAVQDRCIAQLNGHNWPLQDATDKRISHGAYLRIHVPPWTGDPTCTAQAIWQAQTGQPIPSVEDAFPVHFRTHFFSSTVSEAYTASELDSYGDPQSRNEEPDVDPADWSDASDTDPPDVPDLPHLADADLVPHDDFHGRVFANWRAEAVIEVEEMGPVGYYAVWYVSSDRMHRCDRPRHIGLTDDHDTWMRRIAELWRDTIDHGQPLNFHFVDPEPPASIFDEHLAGHIILSQHLRPHECATHMTVIRNDLRDKPHIVWAMVARRHANKAMIIGWHLVAAVCPPMAPRNLCTCRSGDLEIRDGADIVLRDGQSIHTLVERLSRASEDAARRLLLATATASQRRHGAVDDDSHSPDDEGNYFGVAEFPGLGGSASSSGPRQLCLDHLIPDKSSTTIVRLIQGLWNEIFPPFVEVVSSYTDAGIQVELRAWGFDCKVYLFAQHDVAFCVPDNWQPPDDTFHYMYASTDSTDGNGAFVHSSQQQLSVLQHMQFLHQLGYTRAAVIDIVSYADQLQLISFQDVSATLAPDPTRHRSTSPWPTPQPLQENFVPVSAQLLDLPDGNDRYRLQMRRSVPDVISLLKSGLMTLCTDVSYLELPDFVATALQQAPRAELTDHFDRLVIYTDGSSKASLRRTIPDRTDDATSGVDTWAFIVLGERYAQPGRPHQLCFLGWQAQSVLYQENLTHFIGSTRLGSEVAEREGLFWALMWRIGIDARIPTCFRPDNLTTIGQAQGTFGAADVDTSFRCLRAAFQILENILPGDLLRVEHTLGHAGDPWNEFADAAAKQEAVRSFLLPRQQIDMREWIVDLPYLWTYVATEAGLPNLSATGHVPIPPELPMQSLPPQTLSWSTTSTFDIRVSLGSGNVGSLYRGPEGHGGKVDYLRQQMKMHRLNALGIQEARSEKGLSLVDGVLRIGGGAQGHLYGVELWINMCQPAAYTGSKPHFFHRSNFVVTYADARLLIVHAVTAFLDCWFIVAHAPHSGRPLSEREHWWSHCSEALHQHTDGGTTFVFIDANSPTGRADDIHVGQHDDHEAANTPFLRHFLADHALCLPSTFSCHSGPHDTWTSPDGTWKSRIDYVAVPASLRDSCMHSEVVQSFDLGQDFDHQLAAVDMHWHTTGQLLCTRRDGPKGQPLSTSQIGQIPTSSVRNHVIPSWDTDIDAHVAEFNKHATRLVHADGPTKPLWKKPCIDAETWCLRKDKLAAKKALRHSQQVLRQNLLRGVFAAWKAVDLSPWPPPFIDTVGASCTALRQLAALKKAGGALRKSLRGSKRKSLAVCLDALPPASSASAILRALRPHIGPSNPKKAKRAALPMVKTLDGNHCQTPDAALDRWIEHFMTMEGGQRIEPDAQRALWIDNLRRLRHDSLNMHWDQLPSLVDLEQACRQVSLDKATGPDGVPSSFIHLHCQGVARLLYPQLLKLVLHGQEALIHKGGRLAIAYKGKGQQDCCESYRSLLVSSHPGKTLHKTLRMSCTDIFDRYLQKQQLGGRKHVPVVLPVHLTRTYLRVNLLQGRSTALLFLDLKEAFYRVVRGLVVDVEPDDEMIARLAQRLDLPHETLHELYALLDSRPALEEAGMPPHLRNAVSALHVDTHFYIPGQRDTCRTAVGTRPGDSWADVIFSYAWARMLKSLEQELVRHQILDDYPTYQTWRPFGYNACDESERTAFLGPTWMDDLSLGVSGCTSAEAIGRIGRATGYLLDKCEQFGMTPNLTRGKTEIMLSLKGQGSRKHRAQFFGGTSSGQFPVVRESGTSFINIVGEYVHLGNTVHHTGGHGREMTRRLGIAHQAFTQHRRAIYANPALSLLRRRELFETLIVSKLLYSAETWVPRTLKEKDRLHAGIIRLYRRLCKLPHDAALRDDDVLCHGDFLTPTELLRRQRLRYLPTLYKCGDLVPWGLLSLDEDWIELLRSDFEWMYAQLCNASRLPDPSHDFQPWHDILVHHPRYWKRLLRRSCEHAILQRQKLYQVRKMHCDIVDELQRHGPLSAVMPLPQPQAVHEFFGCMHCGLACRSLGGEGAHMFRRHGERASHRRFCEGTQCLACLKEFHTLGRLSHHVRRSAACQTILQQRGFWSTQGEGEGSQLHAEQERVHNGLRLVQQAAGPNLPQPGGPAPPAVHQECLTLFAELLLDSRAEAFERRCRESVPEFIISWTMFRATLSHAWNAMTDDDWELAADRKDLYALCFQRLQDPRTWTIFQHQDPVVQAKHSHLDLYDMETWFLKLASQNSGPWTAHPKLERQPVRERIVLHLFSGRRRHGDLQEFMEKIAADQQDEMLFVVSIDIVVDSRFGDVRNSYTRQFWLSAIRAGYVLALLAGPPCNTWSAARAHQLLGDRRRHAPRVVRPADEMWGASSLSLRELRDVSVGNELLIFTLVAFIHLYITQGYAIVEHPAPPRDEAAASIWRLPIMALILALPGVDLHRILQGLFGAESAKPTGFLTLNLPSFISTLHSWRLCKDPPAAVSIGQTDSGEFRTTKLKEYPPALCAALANCFMRDFLAPATDCAQVPTDFLKQCKAMICHDFGDYLGPDFVDT